MGAGSPATPEARRTATEPPPTPRTPILAKRSKHARGWEPLQHIKLGEESCGDANGRS